MSEGKDENRGDGSRTNRSKAPYRKPVLIEYGAIAKLTQSGGSTTNEPAAMMKPCL